MKIYQKNKRTCEPDYSQALLFSFFKFYDSMFPVLSQLNSIGNGILQAQFIGPAITGMSKPGTMIHTGTDNRKSQGDIHPRHSIPMT